MRAPSFPAPCAVSACGCERDGPQRCDVARARYAEAVSLWERALSAQLETMYRQMREDNPEAALRTMRLRQRMLSGPMLDASRYGRIAEARRIEVAVIDRLIGP